MKRLLISFALLVAAEPSYGANYYEPHFSSRTMTVATQSWGLGPGSVMMLGDSNTEMMRDIVIGGCQILNAGFGGAATADLVERGPMLADMAKPSVVHVMLGTNDALRKLPASGVEQSLKSIVSRLHGRGTTVVLWTLPPVSKGAGDLETFDSINKAIISVAREVGAVVEDNWASRMIAPDGYAAPGWLVGDGIHLTPNGQIERARRIAEINREIFEKTGGSCLQ